MSGGDDAPCTPMVPPCGLQHLCVTLPPDDETLLYRSSCSVSLYSPWELPDAVLQVCVSFGVCDLLDLAAWRLAMTP